jgi:hypothetical protein
MVFTFEQILIVGSVASLLASAIAWLVEKGLPWFLKVTKIKVDASVDLGRWVKTIIVGVVSFGLGWWWYPASLPAFPVLTGDVMNGFNQFVNWFGLLVAALTPYVGSAMAVYNLLISYIVDPSKREQLLKDLIARFIPSPTPPTPPAPVA